MSLEPLLVSIKWGCLLLFFSAGTLGAWSVMKDPDSLPHRVHLRYVTHLDRKLRCLFWPARGRWVFIGQLFALEGVGLACVWMKQPWVALGVPAVVVGPSLVLERLRVRRIERLDKQLDGFLLTLANALRATPSLGNALGHAQRLLDKPMREELHLALQEMRVGSSVEQALLNLGGRIQSASLDSALLAVLIGRQIGGDLTKVLETTAATLREMARLRGVLRSKTAEAKAQMWILGAAPLLIALAFNTINPGFFDPLFTSWMGRMLLIAAIVFWIASLLIARHVLAVKL